MLILKHTSHLKDNKIPINKVNIAKIPLLFTFFFLIHLQSFFYIYLMVMVEVDFDMFLFFVLCCCCCFPHCVHLAFKDTINISMSPIIKTNRNLYRNNVYLPHKCFIISPQIELFAKRMRFNIFRRCFVCDFVI